MKKILLLILLIIPMVFAIEFEDSGVLELPQNTLHCSLLFGGNDTNFCFDDGAGAGNFSGKFTALDFAGTSGFDDFTDDVGLANDTQEFVQVNFLNLSRLTVEDNVTIGTSGIRGFNGTGRFFNWSDGFILNLNGVVITAWDQVNKTNVSNPTLNLNNDTAGNFTVLQFNSCILGNGTTCDAIYGGGGGATNKTWPVNAQNGTSINVTRLWINDALWGNLTNLKDYLGFRNNTVDTDTINMSDSERHLWNGSAVSLGYVDVSGSAVSGDFPLTVDADATALSGRFDGSVGIATNPTAVAGLTISKTHNLDSASSLYGAQILGFNWAENTAGSGALYAVQTQVQLRSETQAMRTRTFGGLFNSRLSSDTNFTSTLANMVGGWFEVDTTGTTYVGSVQGATAGVFRIEPVNALFKTAIGLDIDAFNTGYMVTGGANTIHAIRILDVTNTAGVNGTNASTINAIYIEAMDGANQDASHGNLNMSGGDWNTGHLVLGESHIWFNTTHFLYNFKAPTDATDGFILNLTINADGYNTTNPVLNLNNNTAGNFTVLQFNSCILGNGTTCDELYGNTGGGGADVKSGSSSITEGTPVVTVFASVFSGTPYCSCGVVETATASTCVFMISPNSTGISLNYNDGAGGGAQTTDVNWICTDAGDS